MLRSLSRCSLLTLLGALMTTSLSSHAAEPTDEKLLLGFEESEFDRLGNVIKLTKKEGMTKDGTSFTAWDSPGGFRELGQWMVYKGNASQGQHALGIRLVTLQQHVGYSNYIGTKVELPPEPVFYYGLLNDPYAAKGAMLNTCGVFRRIFPTDWSAYDLLRLDAYGEEVKQTIRVVLEDEEIGPPIVRNMTIEPGKWVTLEIDLRAAARERGLELKRMASLAIGVAELAGKPKTERPYNALIDNLRLSGHQAPAKLPVVRDATSFALPEYYRASKPQPEKFPDGPTDRTPLKLEKPTVIPSEKVCNIAPVGWVAAYDNQRLLIGFDGGASREANNPIFLLQSLDGCKSWRGLDGGEKPSVLKVFNTDHGSGRGDVVGTRGDVVLFNNLGCAGPALASLRLFARKLTLTAKGWEVREMPTLVDCDLRHCNSNQSIIRTPDGRLWAAYGLVGRLGLNCINVRYSDDDGISWKSWVEGKSGLLPGTMFPDEKRVGFGYGFDEPCLVPFGKGIACIWQERHREKPYSYDKLKWARFDGQAWTFVEEIEEPKRVHKGGAYLRPPTHAVSLGGKEIFLTSALFPGVLHYRDGQWKQELAEVPPGSLISIAGDKTVVVIAAVSEAFNKGPVVIRSWQRSGSGQWSAAVDLAQEEQPLSIKHDSNYVVRPALVVQSYAPPNFVPVAWTCEGQKWVKILRVPVAN
jgi:hypothetical protein